MRFATTLLISVVGLLTSAPVFSQNQISPASSGKNSIEAPVLKALIPKFATEVKQPTPNQTVVRNTDSPVLLSIHGLKGATPDSVSAIAPRQAKAGAFSVPIPSKGCPVLMAVSANSQRRAVSDISRSPASHNVGVPSSKLISSSSLSNKIAYAPLSTSRFAVDKNVPSKRSSEAANQKETTRSSVDDAPSSNASSSNASSSNASSSNIDSENADSIPLQPLAQSVPNPDVNPIPQTPPAAAPVTSKAPVPYWMTSTPFAPEGETRRALPAPLDPVFPSTEYVGAATQTQIGIPDTNPVFPLEREIYKACPLLKKARIEIYGWTNPGADRSSSAHSNIPLSYAIVPNRVELDQQVFRVERYADTVQQDHMDWGFRATMIYGIDTRYTVSDGWYPASGQVLGQNRLYSWDPVELYGVQYIPKIGNKKIFDGMTIKYGRYISPPDIEAQLAPDNYLWTHSLMFTVDNYTQTGILGSIKLNPQWMIQAGIHSGDDIAPWNKAAIPSAEAFLRWQSKSNKDSIYGGMNSINNGHYRLADKDGGSHGHDNLQQFNVTWGHRFSRRVHMMTEGYYIYEINALVGGTVTSGSPRPYYRGTGPGAYLPGMSQAWGLVNYTNFKITDKDYITIRPVDFLGDPRGVRTGYRTTYGSWTIGWCHRFNNLLCIRPEIRYERALNEHGGEPTPYDNGTRRSQFTIGFDVIQRF